MLKIPRTEIYSLFSIYLFTLYKIMHCFKSTLYINMNIHIYNNFVRERERERAAQIFDALTLITYILSENLSGEEK